MSINKSEEFVYFQNKAKHYDNIKKAKPIVKDKLEKPYRHTINHDTQKRRSLEPHLKEYSIKVENLNLVNRLQNINKSKRTEVSAQGNYSRYYKVERNFRTKHPYDEQCKRKINLQNQQMVERIEGVKPAVGTNSVWNTEYHKSLSHRRNLSRYLNGQKSKGSLHISTQKFMPQHYRSFIYKHDELDSAHSPNTIAILPRQKLIQLPRIRYNLSKSVLNTERSKETLEIQ